MRLSITCNLFFVMKKTILLAIAGLMCVGLLAQTKTAYVDVYVRGGGQHMKVSLMFDGQIYKLAERSNMGTVLGVLGANGWTLDQSVSGLRPYAFLFSEWTRHKTHLIMKKEYTAGDPYESLKLIIVYKVGKGSQPVAVVRKEAEPVVQKSNDAVESGSDVVDFADKSSWKITNYEQAQTALAHVMGLIDLKKFNAAQEGLKQIEAWYNGSGLELPAFEEAWNNAQKRLTLSSRKNTK